MSSLKTRNTHGNRVRQPFAPRNDGQALMDGLDPVTEPATDNTRLSLKPHKEIKLMKNWLNATLKPDKNVIETSRLKSFTFMKFNLSTRSLM
jgi:hypothetical protein